MKSFIKLQNHHFRILDFSVTLEIWREVEGNFLIKDQYINYPKDSILEVDLMTHILQH